MLRSNFIIIEGAQENNLKNISLKIPKNKLVVVTGVSGSGKSSLAFDTIYAEGYRRYMENFSPGARFFLNPVKKPKIRKVENLPPAIAISQRINMNNPRSTVGTLTGIYDFIRSIFAAYGQPYCSVCGEKMIGNNLEEIVDRFKGEPRGTQLAVVARWRTGAGGVSLERKLKAIKNLGYARVRINGRIITVREALLKKWEKNEPVDVVVDRIVLDGLHFDRERLIDSLKTALKVSSKHSKIIVDNQEEVYFSLKFICPRGCQSMERLSYKNFSFNSPEGACLKCDGLGQVARAEPDKIIPNKKLSLAEGAILPWCKTIGKQERGNYNWEILTSLSRKYNFSLTSPIEKISQERLEKILYGTGDEEIDVKINGQKKKIKFEGVVRILEGRYHQADSSFIKNELEKFMSVSLCDECLGKRLKKDFLSVKFSEVTMSEILEMEINDLLNFFEKIIKNKSKEEELPLTTISEIINRLRPIVDVGLGYLDINRGCQTLSGGEFQRIRLANQLTSGLSGVIYILDEPSIGLHSRDNKKLINTLRGLRDQGNSLIIVEHDKEIINSADYIIDIGPGAGEDGGKVIFQGDRKKLLKSKTQTAEFLRKKGIVFGQYKKKNKFSGERLISIKGVRHNNLNNVDLDIPLGGIVSIVGVSGSGKSSLINDVLVKALRKEIMRSGDEPGNYRKIQGMNKISKVVNIDQSPLGRSSRSNPATYSGAFSHIRTLFSETSEAKERGFSAGYFSFNMKGGRCEHCQGEGYKKMEMSFLEDAYLICPECRGTRYNNKVRQIKYHGVNISDVLDMNIDYALNFFSSHLQIENKLKTLCEVGLGYLKLGQSASKLSGGEAQRIKLAKELARNSRNNTLYVLDEPSIGLHFSDISRLLSVLRKLADQGNTVLIIEHNVDIIAVSDWVIELGPGGGRDGGRIVFEGTPEQLKEASTETSKVVRQSLMISKCPTKKNKKKN
jgi:excinuclease ABC subunit A